MEEFVLDVRNVSKSFPGVQALSKVNLQVRPHEIVGLVGENGAGKSTLLKILMGAYQPDEGEIIIHGKAARIGSVKEAMDHGLAMIFQEQSVLPNLTVGENIFLGHEDEFVRFGFINWGKLKKEARRQLDKVELNLDPGAYTGDLNFATRQMVELARVMSLEDYTRHEPIVILDEPTTVLEKAEVELLFSKLRSLKERASIIFVSHHLEEIIDLCDRVYVFKDGKNVGELNASEASQSTLHHMMVGRSLQGEYYRQSKQIQPQEKVVLSIQNLNKAGQYKNISFDLHAGEIIGFTGVLGSGREDICRVIAGIEKPDSGRILVNNTPLKLGQPLHSIQSSIGYVPQERGVEGLVLYLNIGQNITLPDLRSVMPRGFLDLRAEKNLAVTWIKKMSIKTPGPNALCLNLSGGNQQKVVLSRWLASRVKIFVLDHPTRGIDVGAKEEIYELIRELAKQGYAFLLIADTLEETIGLSNTIFTMKDGEITKCFDASPENKPLPVDLIQYMM